MIVPDEQVGRFGRLKALQQSRAALKAAATVKPDEHAQALRIAESTGTPPQAGAAVVATDPDKAKALDDQRDLLLRRFPALPKWMRNPHHAGVGKDDTPALSKVVEASTQARLFGTDMAKVFADAARHELEVGDPIADPFNLGIANLGASLHHLAVARGFESPEEGAAAVARYKARAAKINARKPASAKAFDAEVAEAGPDKIDVTSPGWLAALSGGYPVRDEFGLHFRAAPPAEGAPPPSDGIGIVSAAETALDVVKAAGRHPVGALYATAQNLPNAVPTMALGAIGSLAGPAGFAGGSFAGSAITEYGAWIDQVMNERPSATQPVLPLLVGTKLDEPMMAMRTGMTDEQDILAAYRDPKFMQMAQDQALRKSLGTAGVDALFSFLAGAKLAGAVKGGESAAKKAITGIREVATQMAGESASEAAGQLAARGRLDVADVILEGLLAGPQSAVEVGIGTVAHGAADGKAKSTKQEKPKPTAADAPPAAKRQAAKTAVAAVQAQQDAHHAQATADAVKATKVHQRLPTAMRALVDEANQTGGKPAPSIDVEAWDAHWIGLGKSPAAEAARVTGSPTAYSDAKAKLVLDVPYARVVEALTDPAFAPLNAKFRYEPGGMTAEEAGPALDAIPEQLEAAAKEAQEAAEAMPTEEGDARRSEIEAELGVPEGASLLFQSGKPEPTEGRREPAMPDIGLPADEIAAEIKSLTTSMKRSELAMRKAQEEIDRKAGDGDEALFGPRTRLQKATERRDKVAGWIKDYEAQLASRRPLLQSSNLLRAAADAIEAAHKAPGVVGRLLGKPAEPVADAVRQALGSGQPEAAGAGVPESGDRPSPEAGVSPAVQALAAAAQRDPAGTAARLRELADISDRQGPAPLVAKLTAAIRAAGGKKPAEVARILVAFVDTMKARFPEVPAAKWDALMVRFAKGEAPVGALEQAGLPPTIKIGGIERQTTNALGHPLAPTTKGVRAFWKWFGESQAVDSQGRPLVLYHGTPRGGFSEFAVSELGTRTGASSARHAFFFSDAPEVAGTYADPRYDVANAAQSPLGQSLERIEADIEAMQERLDSGILAFAEHDDAEGGWIAKGRHFDQFGDESTYDIDQNVYDTRVEAEAAAEADVQKDIAKLEARREEFAAKREEAIRKASQTSQVYPVYLRALEPYDHNFGGGNYRDQSFTQLMERAKAVEADSVFFENVEDANIDQREPSNVWAVFDVTQIKSAIGNRGTFDPSDPSILHQQARGAYDRATRTIHLFETADASTAIHESGHFIRDTMRAMAADPESPPALREMAADIDKAFGVEPGAEWTVPQEEAFATQFEAFVMEGKAPSAGLRRAFAVLRDVLLRVYKAIRDIIGVDAIPAETRAIFDRMLATDAEIKAAEQEASLTPLFPTDAEVKDIADPKIFETYSAKISDARDVAVEKLTKKLAREMEASQKQRRAERLDELRADTAAKVEDLPAVKALKALQVGPAKLSRSEMQEILKDTPNIARRLDKMGLLADDGTPAQAAAEAFGFRGPVELADGLLTAENRDRLVEKVAAERLQRESPDLMRNKQALRAEARAAVITGKREEVVAAELRMLGALLKPGQKSTRTVTLPATAEVRARAKAILAGKPIRDIKPSAYLAAVTRQGIDAQNHFKAGDLEQTIKAKRAQQMNLALYRDALAMREQAMSHAKRLDTMRKDGPQETLGKAGKQHADAMNKLLSSFSFRMGSLAAADRATIRQVKIADYVAAQDAAARTDEGIVAPDLPVWVVQRADDPTPVDWRNLTLTELSDLRESADQLLHIAGLKNKLRAAQAERDLAAVVDPARDQIKKRPAQGQPDSWMAEQVSGVVGGVHELDAMLTPIASLARRMDGDEAGGPVREALVVPMNSAQDAEVAEGVAASKEWRKRNRIFTVKEKFGLSLSVGVPDMPRRVTGENAMMVALYWGSAQGRDRLFNTFTRDQVEAILSTLTDKQVEFINRTWAADETRWPRLKALSERLYGSSPPKIDALPYTITRADGTTAQLTGGHTKLKYSGRRADEHTEAELAAQMRGGAYGVNRPRASSLKERVKHYDQELRLDFGVLAEATTEDIHLLTHMEPLKQLDRTLSRLQDDMIEHWGKASAAQFRKTYEDMAKGTIGATGVLQRSVGYLRTGTVVQRIGFDVMAAAMNITDIPAAWVRVGPHWMALGVARMFANQGHSMLRLCKFIDDSDSRMANRGKSMQRELREAASQLRPSVRSTLTQASFAFLAVTQYVTDRLVWMGSYEKQRAHGKTHGEAVDLARQDVIDTQGSGLIGDLPAVMREGGEFQKLFTTFMGYATRKINLTAEAGTRLRNNWKNPAEHARFAINMLLLWWLPAAISVAAYGGSGGDDDDDVLENIAQEALSQGMSGIPLVREAAGVVKGYTQYRGAVGESFLYEFARFAQQIEQGDADEAAVESTLNISSIMTHLPLSSGLEAYKALEEFMDGSRPRLTGRR